MKQITRTRSREKLPSVAIRFLGWSARLAWLVKASKRHVPTAMARNWVNESGMVAPPFELGGGITALISHVFGTIISARMTPGTTGKSRHTLHTYTPIDTLQLWRKYVPSVHP